MGTWGSPMNYGIATLVTFSTYPLTSIIHHQIIKQNNRNSIHYTYSIYSNSMYIDKQWSRWGAVRGATRCSLWRGRTLVGGKFYFQGKFSTEFHLFIWPFFIWCFHSFGHSFDTDRIIFLFSHVFVGHSFHYQAGRQWGWGGSLDLCPLDPVSPVGDRCHLT